MAKKFYAVKEGRETGIFTTWNECLNAVHKYPGAIYKGFNSEEEAKKWMGIIEDKTNSADNIIPENTAIAYTDGSYNPESDLAGYGIYFMYKELTLELSGSCAACGTNNVAGELEAVLEAIDTACGMNAEHIIIRHDYKGVAEWDPENGSWEAKNPITKGYQDWLKHYRKTIKISFEHVKGHSGDKGNNIADNLAKKGAKLK